MKNGLLKTLSFLCLFSIIACSNVNSEQSFINNISSSIHDVITTSNIESSSSLDKTISSEEASSSSIHVHTPSEKVIENKIEATCLDEGSYDEVIYCSTCKEELSREHKIVEALGHDYSSWVTIVEANENQDGKRKKECSRCHDIVEEIVPTTSPFTFVLDENNLSYGITGYNKLYEENETIILPDKFNNLPVTSLSFTVQRVKPSKNPVKILLPLTINTFWGINVVFKEDGQANSSYFDPIDIYYQGSLTDFLSITNKHSLYHNPYNLFIKNNYEFEKVNCLVVPDGTKEIKDKQFYNFQFEELICPTSLVKIGKNCFAENFTLKKVSLNEGLVSVGSSAFSGTGIKSIEIPSTIIDNSSYNGWFTGCVDLLCITIKEGAKIVQKSLGDNHTVMLLDYSSDEHTTTFKDFTVTKDIASECEIFEYQHFSFLKRINEFYLIKYNGEEVDATLPSKIVYKDETINSYTVLSNALLSYCLLVGGENNSWGLSQAVYSKNANYGFPIQTLHFSSSVKAIESNGFGNAYLEQIYFDGSLSELKSVLKNAPMSKDNISTLLAYSYVGKPRYRANNTIFYLDNNGEYVSLDLTNYILV